MACSELVAGCSGAWPLGGLGQLARGATLAHLHTTAGDHRRTVGVERIGRIGSAGSTGSGVGGCALAWSLVRGSKAPQNPCAGIWRLNATFDTCSTAPSDGPLLRLPFGGWCGCALAFWPGVCVGLAAGLSGVCFGLGRMCACCFRSLEMAVNGVFRMCSSTQEQEWLWP